MILRQKLWLTFIVLLNAALWIIPDDVVANIARDEQTLLGRYSRTHFAWILAAAALSIVSLYIDWSTGPTYKRRWFQVLATTMFLVPTVAVVDSLLRTPDAMHYVRDAVAYHRPVNAVFTESFVDRPVAIRTYPDAPPGYGAVDCTGTTDKRGYRNRVNADQFDIIALGDSFTEGSKVSDEHPWPVRLAERTETSVGNLGMSGYDPLHYLESLRVVGLSLKPRVVLCMIYEGNDFRSTKSDEKRRNPSFSTRVADYADRSPLIKALDRVLINTFGPMGATVRLSGGEVLDWLPLAIPAGPAARHYAFEPKQLRDLLQTRDDFAADKHWHNPRNQIAEMNRLCAAAGAKFVLIYAPTKAHVVLPLVADRLDAVKVRAFTAIDYSKPMPEADRFLPELLSRLDAKESVIAEWCKTESILFFSATASLRDAVNRGEQMYYTYDQHWTPLGHEVVARAVSAFLADTGIVPAGPGL